MDIQKIDYALIGHNFSTLLLSVGLMARGKKILFLEDNRLNFGDFSSTSLTALDVHFLKIWGEKYQLDPLIKIEKYLVGTELNFFVAKKEIILGQTPFRNRRELSRKFPHFFGSMTFYNQEEQEKFDAEYLSFCQKITEDIYAEKNAAKIYELLLKSLPPIMFEIYQTFLSKFRHKKNLLEKEMDELNTLCYLTRGFFQNHLSSSGSPLELLHLFLSLTSPYYRLDHEKFFSDLLKIHKEKGGGYKKLSLKDLKFKEGLLKSFEIESLDGIIRPKKLAFIGGQSMPGMSSVKAVPYTTIHLTLTFDVKIPKLLAQKKLIFSSPMKIGTDRPIWEINFEKDYLANVNVVVRKKFGSKVSFIEKKLLKELLGDLGYLYPEFNWGLTTSKLKFTQDIFLETKNFTAADKNDFSFLTRTYEIGREWANWHLRPLKKIQYFGPMSNRSLGTFSNLIEMKIWKDSI